jgi:branched-chain amino acid transport system ATP-binding protein
MPSPPPVLAVERVDLAYGEVQVVFGVSLEVGERELVGLVGGNGSGKSTILRAISGMLTPRAGRIVFRGRRINGLTPHETAAMGIAHIPMGRQLFTAMTVEENLLAGSFLPRARARRAANLEKVYALFPRLGERRAEPAASLSGGEQQMLAVGRGLMLEPSLFLMDEPTMGLSPRLVGEVARVIRAVADTGVPILLVEQNIRLALRLADRAYVLENGRLVLQGPSGELAGHPEIRRAYLGL